MREANTLIPYRFLVELGKVNEYNTAFRKNAVLCDEEDIREGRENQLDLAQKLVDWVNELASKTDEKEPEFASKIRENDNIPKDIFERYKLFVKCVNSESNIHKSARRLWPTITNHFEKFCISDDWFSWHFTRLLHIYLLELWRLRQKSGTVSKERRVEHDVQDIGYVALLSRVDALLTKDDGCSCLARAAFPQKHVFSSLDEVPEAYACHWS